MDWEEEELQLLLLACCRRGDFDRAREFVETHRANVNCVDDHGRTPLIIASYRSNVHIARLLLENRANVHAEDRHGETALSRAVYQGNVAMAQLLLDHDANVDARIVGAFVSVKYSVLGWAIFSRDVAMVELLLRFRANTQETLYEGNIYTAVYLACWKSSMEIVQLLIDHDDGVDINAFVPRGHEFHSRPAMSPLCKACCWQNNLEMVQLLVQHGARVIYNGVYPDVPCPLKHAIERGSFELVLYLLDHSRFLEPANQENAQVPEIVGDNHPLSVPLESAIECNKLQAAQLLVNRGANVNDKPFLWQCVEDEPIWTPRDSRIGIVRLLLRAAGANVNLLADNGSGETPLWAAAKNGHVESVKELLKAQANVRICDNHGETPLGVAHRKGHKRVVYLLLRTSPHVWPRLAGALFPVTNDTQEEEQQQQHPARKKQKTS